MSGLTRKLALILSLALWGCEQGSIPDSFTQLPSAALPTTTTTQQLDIQFLGTGGIFLRSGGNAVLGDPFFSNPPISDWLLLRPLSVRMDLIDRYLPPTDQLRGILVAHAHHDHAMDVPYIATRTAPDVVVYGSDTLRNSLAPAVEPQRLIGLNRRAAGRGQHGEWVYLNDALRLLPIYSGHAPHLMGRVFNSDVVEQPLARLPQTVLDWQSGETLSFVLDFLVEGEPAFRLFYQSSAADAPYGLPPRWLLDEPKRFDLALLGVANHGKLEEYPIEILRALQPRAVMILHWDVFWDEYSQQETQPAPGLELGVLAEKVASVLDAQVPVYLPQRGAHIRLQERL